jgi:hypothetical protein
VPWSRVLTVASYTLVLVLTVELAVWEAFLVGARPFGTGFPVAALLAVVGNVALGVAGARIVGSRNGAVAPGVVWLALALALGSGKGEGDRVVPQTWRGLSFLLLGALAAAAVGGGLGSPRPRGTTPEDPDGR